jgi:hypothetical protein
MAAAKPLSIAQDLARSLQRNDVVLAETVLLHGQEFVDELRLISKPLYSTDGGLTYRAYPLCPSCLHDVHDGVGKCTGLTAQPTINKALGSHCMCESTP